MISQGGSEAVADAWGMVPTSQRLTPHPTASTHAHREDGKSSACGMRSAGYARWGSALQPHMSSVGVVAVHSTSLPTIPPP